VANAFISIFNSQTMHMKSVYTQQHTTAWQDSNLGLLVPEENSMSNAPSRQGQVEKRFKNERKIDNCRCEK
jgi:hypothetical protein